jgi:hypothetical protein
MRGLLMTGAVLVALAVSAGAANATPIVIGPFSGTGTSGNLASPSAEPWLINCAGLGPSGVPCPAGDFGWGSPGVGQSFTPYVGATPAMDFEITFPDLLIDPSQIPVGITSDCAGREAGGTTFCQDLTEWTVSFNPAVDPHSIAFFAPVGTSIPSGDEYFVNIFLENPTPNGSLPTSVSFTGGWTAEPAAVPEPASMLLVGSGVTWVLARRKKGRAAR